MSNRQRLDRIAAPFATHLTRCDQCIGWPPTSVVWPTGSINAADPTPRECDNCGYQPDVIRVVYEDRDQPPKER